ncbi:MULTISPECIES: RICIN domain-containing protein [unclassified Microbulbifer]|uniref:RICIN domain-containing protein n=1 Tax=unclassified Microbulbifer TaxID=2619833 RepID=UPI0027E3B3A8|nr:MULTISPECIES: RICIN domain-containing protein [unclassified Microbulbifer]
MNSLKMLEGRTWLLGLASLIVLAASDVRADNCDAPPTSGDAYKLINRASGYALDVAGNSTEDGANVLQWSEHTGTNQQFLATDLGNGYWSLLAVHSGDSLDVAGSSTSDGANIQQMAYSGASNQQWQLKKSSSGGFAVVARHSGKVIAAESSSQGANVSQAPLSGDSLQRWYFNPVNGSCGNGPTGFAAQPGNDGLSTTTGGSAATSTTTVTSCSALTAALTSSSPEIIHIPDNTTIDCLSEGRATQACAVACPDYQDPGEITFRIPPSTHSCTELGSVSDATVTVLRYDTRINVTDNKTLIGLGPNSRIEGATLNLSGSSNIIVRNLTIANVNPHLVEAGDGITLYNSSHVWIDHVGFSMISDGHVDANNSENVTLSWNHFDGRNNYVCANQHWYVSVVGDTQVSFDHNFFDYTGGRNPKVYGSASRAHIYNNYYKKVSFFGVNTSDNGQALVENNNFDDTHYPHWNLSGYMSASGNVYTGQSATDDERDSGDSVFGDVNLYDYTLDDANDLPAQLEGRAGPQ